MTRLELLLALDAVLTAAEGRLPIALDKTTRKAIEDEVNAAYPVFDAFLTAQRAAVEKLAANPNLWGGE